MSTTGHLHSPIPITKVEIRDLEIARVVEVLKSGWILQGPAVKQFEESIRHFCQVPHALATSSGTTALHLALISMGIKKGDEVIVPSFSWIASANSIRYCGATPIFCDIDPETYNMTPSLADKVISKKTKAIMVVHQFGSPCDLQGFENLAKVHKLQLLEDAACAIGSRYHGEPIGSCRYAPLACLSFHPRKVVTTGEGGMVLTQDPEIALQIEELRNHGLDAHSPSGTFTVMGYNYRMTDFQAALGTGQVKRLPSIIQHRRDLAHRYIGNLRKITLIECPAEVPGAESNFQSFMIRFPEGKKVRDQVAEKLKDNLIDTKKSISPIHLQPCYADLPPRGSLSETEKAAEDGLILPLYEHLKFEDIDRICELIDQFV